jgi:hypothetical protein
LWCIGRRAAFRRLYQWQKDLTRKAKKPLEKQTRRLYGHDSNTLIKFDSNCIEIQVKLKTIENTPERRLYSGRLQNHLYGSAVAARGAAHCKPPHFASIVKVRSPKPRLGARQITALESTGFKW